MMAGHMFSGAVCAVKSISNSGVDTVSSSLLLLLLTQPFGLPP